MLLRREAHGLIFFGHRLTEVLRQLGEKEEGPRLLLIPMVRFVDPPAYDRASTDEMIGRRTVELPIDILACRQTSPASVTLPHKLVVPGSAARAL